MAREGRVPSSFRDPSGHLFVRDGTLLRQINQVYRDEYDTLLSSGLYEALTRRRLLIPHEESKQPPHRAATAYKVIEPQRIPFISYPYEWSFSQLRDAALLTLEIQKLCLDFGMSLRDSSAYNVQFTDGKPLLIDTLSFERYREGRPWVAYRQYCQHFLAPLALAAYRDVRLMQLLRTHIDGVPLDLASRLLPWRTRLRLGLMTHVHLHAGAQKRYADRPAKPTRRTMSKRGLLGLIDNLMSATRGLRWKTPTTEWGDYYGETNYSESAMEHKTELVRSFLETVSPATVWDLGANTGRFSRLAAKAGTVTIAFDSDPVAVERLYTRADGPVLPLLIDLTNPSPWLGWNHRERMSLSARGPADTILALALLHHLAIGNNVPLELVAAFLAPLCRTLVIEFVPKSDSQVQRLLATREDIFDRYDTGSFENAFGEFFTIERREPIRESERVLYLMKSRHTRKESASARSS